MEVEHQDRIPPEILREMGDLGFFGLPFSEDDGGLGVGLLGFSLALEQLAPGQRRHRRDHLRQQRPGRGGDQPGRHAGAAHPLAAGPGAGRDAGRLRPERRAGRRRAWPAHHRHPRTTAIA